ncbi:unnamed protein product [Polarella glacialis]|uniref:Uncharacterized protein n=1 Tax=Polarella glacialis TaxID=89957 RepID=A0A813I2W8_POLGL|nr:unnamed protein product [Polarella glacialis]
MVGPIMRNVMRHVATASTGLPEGAAFQLQHGFTMEPAGQRTRAEQLLLDVCNTRAPSSADGGLSSISTPVMPTEPSFSSLPPTPSCSSSSPVLPSAWSLLQATPASRRGLNAEESCDESMSTPLPFGSGFFAEHSGSTPASASWAPRRLSDDGDSSMFVRQNSGGSRLDEAMSSNIEDDFFDLDDGFALPPPMIDFDFDALPGTAKEALKNEDASASFALAVVMRHITARRLAAGIWSQAKLDCNEAGQPETDEANQSAKPAMIGKTNAISAETNIKLQKASGNLTGA